MGPRSTRHLVGVRAGPRLVAQPYFRRWLTSLGADAEGVRYVDFWLWEHRIVLRQDLSGQTPVQNLNYTALPSWLATLVADTMPRRRRAPEEGA